MDVIEALRSRHTCRHFKPQPVLKGTILEILDAANRAPSWANSQPWEAYVAAGESLKRIRKGFMSRFDQGLGPHPDLSAPSQWPAALRRRIEETQSMHLREYFASPGDAAAQAHLRHNYMFFEAPCVLYLCMEKTLGTWSVFDMGLFAQSILLAALEKGLDTAPAYMLAAYPDLIRSELDIPEGLMILFGIALGYGAEEREAPSPRRHVREMVHFSGFEGEEEAPAPASKEGRRMPL
jgi:nitroreductase